MRWLVFILIAFDCGIVKAKSLRLIKDINFATGTIFSETEIGGLSGLSYDPHRKQLKAISDDRGGRGNESKFASRIYTFELKINESKLSRNIELRPTAVTNLKMDSKSLFFPMFLDPEGIAVRKNGSFLISSEGYVPFLPPGILVFDENAVFISHLSIPSYYLSLKPGERQEQGVQFNSAFESLDISPDEGQLLVGTEYSLKQDEKLIERTDLPFSRILLYQKKEGDFIPAREYLYPLDAGGLVDILYQTPTKFLAVERGYNVVAGKNTIHIYESDLALATDVLGRSKIASLEGIEMVKKSLLLDLKDVVAQMNPPKLDNIEGITLGPKLANGHDTLILVSDNNFNENQRTLFLFFEIVP